VTYSDRIFIVGWPLGSAWDTRDRQVARYVFRVSSYLYILKPPCFHKSA